MKILLIIRSLDVGGTETQIAQLARGLARRGIDVRIAVFYTGGVIEKQLQTHSIQVTNLNKGEVLAVLNQGTDPQEVIYYKIPVEYEIQGNFLSYLKFRRALSKSNKVINFDREEINNQEEIQGQILSKGTISIVGLPDEYN